MKKRRRRTDAFGSRLPLPQRQEVNDQRKAVETFTSQTLAAMKQFVDLFLFLSLSICPSNEEDNWAI